jgi:hypothetical protein
VILYQSDADAVGAAVRAVSGRSAAPVSIAGGSRSDGGRLGAAGSGHRPCPSLFAIELAAGRWGRCGGVEPWPGPLSHLAFQLRRASGCASAGVFNRAVQLVAVIGRGSPVAVARLVGSGLRLCRL